ncbi:MAG: hypothetical protein KDC41_14310 [Saprospiraceae bacterium]|nr:hypothetical protein [Saprospiraceae bacterium]
MTMTKLTQLLAGLLLFSAAFLTACGGDDDADPCGTNFNYTLDLQDEADALSAAASTYAANPTTANCNAFVSAYQDYLNAAEDIADCVPTADQAAYQQAIDDAQAALSALAC